jgi:hypothetical protein
MEIWKFIEGYRSRYGRYRVSNLGRVKNGIGNELRHHKHKKGYILIAMVKDGLNKRVQIHRLVAIAFIPNPDNLPQVNHKDGDKLNNKVSNLQWCTNGFNMAHANANGLRPDYKAIFKAKPTKGKYKLTNDQIIAIKNAKLGSELTRKSLSESHSLPIAIIKDIRGGKMYPYIK